MLIQEDWEREFLKAEIYLIEQQQEMENEFLNSKPPAKIKLLNFNIKKDEECKSLPF